MVLSIALLIPQCLSTALLIPQCLSTALVLSPWSYCSMWMTLSWLAVLYLFSILSSLSSLSNLLWRMFEISPTSLVFRWFVQAQVCFCLNTSMLLPYSTNFIFILSKTCHHSICCSHHIISLWWWTACWSHWVLKCGRCFTVDASWYCLCSPHSFPIYACSRYTCILWSVFSSTCRALWIMDFSFVSLLLHPSLWPIVMPIGLAVRTPVALPWGMLSILVLTLLPGDLKSTHSL